MTHQHYIPDFPLNEFIAGFTYYKGFQPEHRIDRLGSRCTKERFAMAEKTLQSAFAGRLCVNPFIDFAIGKIVTMPSALTIKSIADKTGFSSKHFIKIFSDHVGVPPKLFLRIIRFQRAIREIEIKGTIHWASLAYECGYYDQAHFIADFRGFSGFTPQQYMQRKNGTINYIPVG